ncbi:unnamed protein product, partial [Prorocentrum cordatum]
PRRGGRARARRGPRRGDARHPRALHRAGAAGGDRPHGFVYRRDIRVLHLLCDATGASLGRCFLVFDTVSTRNQFVAAWHGQRMRLAGAWEPVSFATATPRDVLSSLAAGNEVVPEDDPTLWSRSADQNEGGPALPIVSGPKLANFCTACGGRVNIWRRDCFCEACGAPVRGQ